MTTPAENDNAIVLKSLNAFAEVENRLRDARAEVDAMREQSIRFDAARHKAEKDATTYGREVAALGEHIRRQSTLLHEIGVALWPERAVRIFSEIPEGVKALALAKRQADSDAEHWRDICAAHNKRVAELLDYLMVNRIGSAGEDCIDVALRQLQKYKAERDDQTAVKALKLAKEQAEARICNLTSDIAWRDGEIRRLQQQIAQISAARGESMSPAFRETPPELQSNAREDLWQALRPMGEHRAARACEAIRGLITEALTAYRATERK